MKCIKCFADTKVVDSRTTGKRSSIGSIRRRRECLSCNFRFTTIESNREIYYSFERLEGITKKLNNAIAIVKETKQTIDLLLKSEKKER